MDTFQNGLREASLRSGCCPDNSETAVQIRRNPQLRPLYASGWDYYRKATGFVSYNEFNNCIDAVSLIRDDGCILAAGHHVISVARKITNADDNIHIIPSVAFEQNIIEAAYEYLCLLIDFNVSGPWCIALSLFNLQNSLLFVGHGFSFEGKIFKGEDITPPPIIAPEKLDISTPQDLAKILKPIFDFIWREHNYPQSLNYGTNGSWTGR
jgi:hypothetical protein